MQMVSGDAKMGSTDRRPLEPPVVNGSESGLQEAQGNFELEKSLHKKRKKKKKGASDDGTHLEPPGNNSSVLGVAESQSIAELQSLSKKRKKKKIGASDDGTHLEPPGNNSSVLGMTESQSVVELQSSSKKRKKKKIGASDVGTPLEPPGNNISDLDNTESQSIVELQSLSQKRKKKKGRASKDSARAEPGEKNDSELGLSEAQNNVEMKSSTKKRKNRERGTSNGGTCLEASENDSPDLGMTVSQSIVELQPSTKKQKKRGTEASHDSECVEPAENNDSELGLIEAQNNMGMKSSTDKRKKKKRGGKKRKRGGSGDSMCLESAVNNSSESGLVEAQGNVDLGKNVQGNLQEEISTLNDSSTDVNLCLGSEADVGRGTVLLTTQTLPKLTKMRKKRKNCQKRQHIHDAVVAELYSVKNSENNLITEEQIVCQWSDFPDSVQNASKHVNVAKQTLKESKKDNILQMSPEGPRVGHGNKKLLILDINGLLADIVLNPRRGYRPDIVVSRKSVFKRPFCDDFLHFCFEKFNVGVWSSRTKKNVKVVVDFLMGDSKKKLLFCWDQSHCTRTGVRTIENRNKPLVLKELRKLWENANSKLPWKNGDYDESNTLLLDDSPYKALRNPAHTAVFPHPYQFTDIGDNSLGPGGDIRTYLEHLADASNVQEFVRRNPFGQEAISESNAYWGFYSKIIGVDKCKLSRCHR